MSAVQTVVRRSVALACIPLLLAGCDDMGTDPAGRTPVSVVAAAGEGQAGPLGGTLDDSLAVRVEDEAGEPVAGAAVAWTTTAGSVSPVESETGDDGVGRAAWTLGDALGEDTVTATVAGLEPVRFAATVKEENYAGTVDAAGGTVEDDNGQVSVEVPDGAVSEAIDISVEPAEEHPDDPDVVAGAVYDFGPDGTQFDEPVEIAIRYDADALGDVREEYLRLHKAVGDGWERIGRSTVNAEEDVVTGETDGFSVYGVLSVAACELGETIEPGASVDATLEDECVDEAGRHYDSYTLVIDEPSTLEFTATSGAFTPRFRAFGADEKPVASEWADSAGYSRAALGPGTYRLAVGTTEADAGTGGDYAFAIDEAAPDDDACGDLAFATAGAVVESGFTAADCEDDVGIEDQRYDTYPIRLEEGRTYRVTMTGSDETGVSLWGYDSADEQWELYEHRRRLESGTYTLTHTATASGYHYLYPVGVPGVDYEMAIEAVDAEPCEPGDAYQLGVWLTGRFADADCEVDGGPLDSYSLDIDGSRSVRLEAVTNDSIQPSFRIESEERSATVVANFQSEPGFARALLAPGSYTVEIEPGDPADRGHYELRSFDDGHTGNGCADDDPGYYVFAMPGTGMSGTIAESDCPDDYEASPNPDYHHDEFIVRADEGQSYSAQATLDGEGSVSVWAMGEDGYELMGGDWREDAGAVSISHTADADGWLYFYVLAPPVGREYEVSFGGD